MIRAKPHWSIFPGDCLEGGRRGEGEEEKEVVEGKIQSGREGQVEEREIK